MSQIIFKCITMEDFSFTKLLMDSPISFNNVMVLHVPHVLFASNFSCPQLSHIQKSSRKLLTRVAIRVRMHVLFLLQCFEENFLVIGKGYFKQAHGQEIATKLAKTFSYELVQNHAQVKDKWEKLKKKYIAKKKVGVTGAHLQSGVGSIAQVKFL